MRTLQAGKRFARLACAAGLLLCWGKSCACAAEWRLESARVLPAASAAVTHLEETVSDGSRTVPLHVVLFDPKKCALAVVDDPRGEGGLAAAMRSRGALAGTNGGYFHPDRTPLGLVVSGGKVIHRQETARLLSGVVAVKKGGAVLLRAAAWRLSPQVTDALQAGPFLIDRGKAVPGLEGTRSAARTVALADAGGVRALLVIPGAVTLAETAAILAAAPVCPDVKIERALNLDGGSSSALWVDATPAPFSLREWKAVRNYLAIVPR